MKYLELLAQDFCSYLRHGAGRIASYAIVAIRRGNEEDGQKDMRVAQVILCSLHQD